MRPNLDLPPQNRASAVRTPHRRRALACVRCRRRKVRCDGALPACSNCAKAGEECFEGREASAVSRTRLHYLENRVRELEEARYRDPPPPPPLSEHPEDGRSSLALHDQTASQPLPSFAHALIHQTTAPLGGDANLGSSHTPASAAESSAVSVSSQITRNQPLAHEVGLISLSNTTDPKYLGPSSGVTFARLIYESAPQSQGLPLSFVRGQEQHFQSQISGHAAANQAALEASVADVHPIPLPSPAECQQYADAFFDATPFYPFISQDVFYMLLTQVEAFNETSKWNGCVSIRLAAAQLLLILSLGAQYLETRLGANYGSRDLFLAGMSHCSHLNLPGSVEGVQVLLLMVLHSFYNPEGLNAWYLLHTIIASCLDLGLQRRNNDLARQQVRSAVFWSAYSMDRSLTTILGRPLTLRDEAIDQSFPGLDGSDEVEEAATQWHHSTHDLDSNPTAAEAISPPYIACVYSLRFDRIVAEIKLMIYRVARSPRRFPWPQNLTQWQQETRATCVQLLREVQNRQRGRSIGGVHTLSGTTVQRLELKFHQCIMLLYRPSPQIPHPRLEAIQACFNSAMSIIQIHGELHRFSNMECSWLSAHSIFVAAITMLYCLWTYPAVRGPTSLEECLSRAEKAVNLLSFLGQWWSVAREPCQKLSRLILLTREGSESSSMNPGGASNLVGIEEEGKEDFLSGDSRSVLIDELGILRDLFDLGWLNDWDLDSVPPPPWDSHQSMADFGAADSANS
ncbi:fungal-specific transcription factor domain-containing protein [Aspergillus falconensis]